MFQVLSRTDTRCVSGTLLPKVYHIVTGVPLTPDPRAMIYKGEDIIKHADIAIQYGPHFKVSPCCKSRFLDIPRNLIARSSITMPLDRGPSPLRPPIRGTTPSRRRLDALLPVDNDVHPVIHAGRVAVITGAASGIGKAAAIELARLATIALRSRGR